MTTDATTATPPPNAILCPFTVVVDTREQLHFTFTGLRADAAAGRRPLHVPQLRLGLPSGDYSILGCQHEIAVERKSLADLYNTLGHGRRRFTNELERLQAMAWAAVVVEADWTEVLLYPPPHTRLPPKTIHRSVIAWQQRYPRVHWWLCGGRELAEVTTFRLLERWWRDRERRERAAGKQPKEISL